MAIMLPGELAHFLQMFGFDWPEGNEDLIREYANHWQTFANDMKAIADTGHAGQSRVTAQNLGSDIEAFVQRLGDSEGPIQVAADMVTGGNVAAGVLNVMSVVIIGLKIFVIGQLVFFAITLAEAIAAAIPTCGASMTVVPLVEIAVQKAIEVAINLAVEALMGA